MRKLVVLMALLATVGVSCVPPPSPPPPPLGGTGCRELPATDSSGQRQSIRWDGSYGGRFELFDNTTCAGPPLVRWAAYRLVVQGDLASTFPTADARCTELGTAALPSDAVPIGPQTYRYKELVVGNLGDPTGIPDDLWMCAFSYIYNGAVGNWPSDQPMAPE
jgi:hypothetical protein